MKKLALLIVTLLLVCSISFSNAAFAKFVTTDFSSYGNSNALLVIKDNNAILSEVTLNGDVKIFTFENIRFCAFNQLYFCYATEYGEQFIWFFHGNEKSISLYGYTPVSFEDYSITLKQGNTLYEVDMSESYSSSELVVHPIISD